MKANQGRRWKRNFRRKDLSNRPTALVGKPEGEHGKQIKELSNGLTALVRKPREGDGKKIMNVVLCAFESVSGPRI